MGRSEALPTMSEEEIEGFNTETLGTPASRDAAPVSLKQRLRAAVLPAITIGGLIYGGLYDRGVSSASAQEPPASGEEGYDGGRLFLPSLGKGKVEPGATATQVSDRPTRTPSPNATRTPTSRPTEPEQTPTSPASPTSTETATPKPTDTETPTPTEAGPVTELALKTGDTIVITNTSLEYAMVGKNGDEESGAAALGYDFEKMENPVRDGNYVVGTVMRDVKPLTIRTPLDLVDPAMRDRIQQGNPDEDTRLRSEVSIWKGSDKPGVDKPLRITASNNGSAGVYGRTFFGNFNTGAQIELSGRASGNAKTGDMVIMSWNQDTKTAETLTFRCNTQGAQWTILSSTQASSSFAALLESRKTSDGSIDELQAEKELYKFPMGQTDLKVQTKDGNLNILDKDGKAIQTIPLTNAMASGLNFVDFGRTGYPKSQAVITVNRVHISFSHPLEGTPQLNPESRLPTLADLAKANGIRIMAQGDSEFFSSQPGLIELYGRTAHLIDTNSVYTDGADLQSFLIDQNRTPAIVLGAGMPVQELITIIGDHPNSVFQFVARGANNGSEGTVVRPDGTLADKRKLQELLDAAHATRSEVMLNTIIPPDKKLYRASQAEQIASLSPQLRLLEELKTLRNRDVITLLLAGDSRYILDPNLSRAEHVDALKYALRAVQAEGFKAGLANISGPNTAYFSMMGEIASDLKDITLGFGTSLNTESKPVGLFNYTGGPVEDFQTVSYSEGEDALYNALLSNLPK